MAHEVVVAKRLLEQRGVRAIEEVRVDLQPALRETMVIPLVAIGQKAVVTGLRAVFDGVRRPLLVLAGVSAETGKDIATLCFSANFYKPSG